MKFTCKSIVEQNGQHVITFEEVAPNPATMTLTLTTTEQLSYIVGVVYKITFQATAVKQEG